MKNARFSPYCLAVVLMAGLVLILPSLSLAQEATGKILGTIKDPQGAVIPNAKVTVINTATQVTREARTDATGYYQVLALPLGTYQVSVESPGFKKATSDQYTLQINQSLRVDITMQVGSPTESVMVEAMVLGDRDGQCHHGPVGDQPDVGQSAAERPQRAQPGIYAGRCKRGYRQGNVQYRRRPR